MNTENTIEEFKVSVKPKLASLWTSLMFLIIYLDYFALYMPGIIENIQKGRVFVFDISQGFLLSALTLVTIPTLMIFLSVALPAKVNRWANIIIAAINIPLILFNHLTCIYKFNILLLIKKTDYINLLLKSKKI